MSQEDYSSDNKGVRGALPWFKVYTDMIDDPKMMELTDFEHRLWTNMMCLAGRSDTRGKVKMTTKQIKWRLRLLCSEKKIEQAIEKYVQLRMVTKEQDGVLLTNFEKRNSVKPSDLPPATAKRKQNQREREHAAGTQDSANVTPLSRPVTPLDREGDKEGEVETDIDEIADWESETESVDNPEADNRTNTPTNTPSVPDATPSRADALNSTAGPTLTPAPDNFELTDKRRQWASDAGYDFGGNTPSKLDHATRKFLSHYKDKGQQSADWGAKWQQWILSDIEREAKSKEEVRSGEIDNPGKVGVGRWTFAVNDELVALMHDMGLSDEEIAVEHDKFTDYNLAEGKLRADWDAAFRSWLRRMDEFEPH